MFRIAQGSSLGVDLAISLADVGVMENVQTFGISSHQAVLNAVVHHLHEVARTGRPAMEVAFFRSAWLLFPSGGALYIAAAWREGLENRIQMRHHLPLTADHLAVAALQAPDAAAGSDIHVVNSLGAQFPSIADIVYIIRVAAVD